MVARRQQQKCPIIHRLLAGAIWQSVTQELDKQIAARVAALRAANPDASTNVPVELVTASASGLDNNITPQAAAWQIPRVAKARNLSVEQLTQLIAKYSQQPLVKYIGQPVVNIVELNLALDKLDE